MCSAPSSRAVDMMKPQLLNDARKDVKVSADLINILFSFLSKRTQSASNSHPSSSKEACNVGFPQGTLCDLLIIFSDSFHLLSRGKSIHYSNHSTINVKWCWPPLTAAEFENATISPSAMRSGVTPRLWKHSKALGHPKDCSHSQILAMQWANKLVSSANEVHPTHSKSFWVDHEFVLLTSHV